MWRRFREIPGVTYVGGSSSVTMDGHNDFGDVVSVEDFPFSPDEVPIGKRFKFITGDYFEAMQNPILTGRPIEWSDIHERAQVAVVTADFAEEYWGSPAAALGRRISEPNLTGLAWREIIGVVGNVHDGGVSQPTAPVIFFPLTMTNYYGSISLFVPRAMTFAVRTSRPTAISLLPELRAAVGAVNSNLPLADIRTLDDILAQSMARTSFTLVMLAIAATVALALGVVGIYGVISYIVSQRTHEIGVRMALGADRGDVRRMVLRQGVILAGIGVVIGLVAAVGLTRFMSSLLYGVEATDPVTFAAVAAILLAVALVASYLPAVRASRTDPLVALRFE